VRALRCGFVPRSNSSFCYWLSDNVFLIVAVSLNVCDYDETRLSFDGVLSLISFSSFYPANLGCVLFLLSLPFLYPAALLAVCFPCARISQAFRLFAIPSSQYFVFSFAGAVVFLCLHVRKNYLSASLSFYEFTKLALCLCISVFGMTAHVC